MAVLLDKLYNRPRMMHPLHTYKISTLIFVITFLGCSANAIAQPKDSSFKKFGFQIGVNLSNMNFNEGVPPPPEHANASWQPGFTFVFQLRVPLAKKWVLQPEYAYSRRNGSDQTIPTTLSHRLFILPCFNKLSTFPQVQYPGGSSI